MTGADACASQTEGLVPTASRRHDGYGNQSNRPSKPVVVAVRTNEPGSPRLSPDRLPCATAEAHSPSSISTNHWIGPAAYRSDDPDNSAAPQRVAESSRAACRSKAPVLPARRPTLFPACRDLLSKQTLPGWPSRGWRSDKPWWYAHHRRCFAHESRTNSRAGRDRLQWLQFQE